MSGTRANFVYTADNGTQYAILLDKSNGELAGFNLPLFVDGFGNLDRPPKGFKTRKVTVSNELVPSRKRRLTVGSANSDVWLKVVKTVQLPNYDSGITETWIVISRQGENYFNRPKKEVS